MTGERLFCRAVFLAVAVACLSDQQLAYAQTYTPPQGFDPPTIAPDANGVDLLSGHLRMPSPSLQIPADPRLRFTNINDFNIFLNATTNNPANGSSTANFIYNKGGSSESFDCTTDYESAGGVVEPCISHSPLPSFAKGPGGKMYYESRTGRVISFGDLYDTIPGYESCNTVGTCTWSPLSVSSISIIYATTVTYADGEIWSLTYDTAPVQTVYPVLTAGGAPTGSNVVANLMRPNKISSNRGFEMDITYQTNVWNANSGSAAALWLTPATVSISTIGNSSSPLASISIGAQNSDNSQIITDMSGNKWSGNFNDSYGAQAEISAGQFTPPTNLSSQIVASSSSTACIVFGLAANPYFESPLLTSLNKGGNVWLYNYSDVAIPSQCGGSGLTSANRTVNITDPNGFNKTITINQGVSGADPNILPVVTQEIDQLGRKTQYKYTNYNSIPAMSGAITSLFNFSRLLTEIDHPEGDSELFTYDAMANITQHQRVPKPGSGQSMITLRAGYPEGSACFPYQFSTANGASPPPITCTRPLWTKDGNGNETDYTWDAATGQMLTETRPANASGVRPQTRYAYSWLYAFWSNGSGGFTQASTPISVKSSESRCRNSAATGNASAPCSGNDEVLTTYQYGPQDGSQANYLLLRGVTVSFQGSSQTTCYTYDGLGNKISETKALGTTGATCP